MRIYLSLSPNTEPVPFNYQHKLTGALHKWLGENDLHDGISLYSISWLYGGKKINGTLGFEKGAQFFISFHNNSLFERLLKGIQEDSTVAYGMKVLRVEPIPTPDFTDQWRFFVASPVLIRKNLDDGRRQHLTYKDSEVDHYLTRTLKTKLEHAGIDKGENIKVSFDQNYSKANTKLVDIKGIKLRANVCPVIIEATSEIVQFAWNVGVGELTGSAFGALK